MATAAPHVKLLRQLASAKDDYLSGAFDISWDGAKATLYLVFGRPSHAVFDTDQSQIEGEAAIDALLAELPRAFAVSDWRRAMSPQETLSITIDELAGPFVRLAGSYADDPVTDENPEWWSSDDSSPDLAFGLADFPLLPGGRPLWAETSPENVNLAERLAELPPSILILTGAKLRAAAVVSGGDLIDAVWIDADDHARGEAAGMAILGATTGSLAGYALDDPRVAEALTMLWRLPLAVSGIEMSWLDPASMLAAFRADGLDRVLVIDAPVRGIALFSRGGLVAVYSETQRSAVASPERLRSLLSQARGRLTVMERKPRPLAAEAAPAPSAVDFFNVGATEAHPEVVPAAEPALPAFEEVDGADGGPAETDSVSQPPSAQELERDSADAAPEAPAAAAGADAVSDQETNAGDTLEAGAATEATGSAQVDAAEAHLAPPPPPPPDADAAEHVHDAPPPPAADDAAELPRKKRPWWAFGGSRRNRAASAPKADAEGASADGPPKPEGVGGPEGFTGWRVRQPGEAPQPVWQRSRDPGDENGAAPDAAPPHDGTDSEASEPSAAAAWSIVDRTASPAEPVAAPSDPGADVDAAPPSEQEVVSLSPDEHATPPESAGEAGTSHEPAAEAGTHEPEAAIEHEPAAQDTALAGGAHASDEPAAGPGAEVEAAADHEPSHEAPGDVEQRTEVTHDFWADFATPEDEPEPQHAPTAAEAHESDEVRSSETDSADDRSEPEPEGAEGAEDGETASPRASERTVGPWSWPLAETELPVGGSSSSGGSTSSFDDDPEHAVASPSGAAADDMPSGGDTTEQGFFTRDEPVGSQFVDFDEVRKELVQIGVVWLGEKNAVPVTALLNRTRSTIDDFVSTIDTIRGLHVEGQDPASIQAMAREMHQQAAERLCGA